MLEALDRDNLFLVPLDDRRQWYRYHHLFADVLQARLLDEQPERVAQLHRLASDWYERERRPGRGDPARDGRRRLRGRGRPDGAGDARPASGPARGDDCAPGSRACPTTCSGPGPVLCNSLAGALHVHRQLRGGRVAARRGRAMAREPRRRATRTMVVADQRGVPPAAGRHRRPPRRARARAAETSRPRSPSPGARSTIALPDDHLARAAASALQGLAAWTTGDLELAHASYAGVPGRLRADGSRLRRARLLDHAGRHPGRPGSPADAARRTYEQALDLAARHGISGAARNRGHVRRSGRPPPRARRPAGRPERPGAEPRARRARRAAAERLPLAGGDGAGLRGRG